MQRTAPDPVATWILMLLALMLLALTLTLLLPGWNGAGPLLAAWFMVLRVVAGLVGVRCASLANRLR